MKEAILTNAYQPGQMLTESEIVQQFGISRTPCREVLRRLREDRLVTGVPYKANYISLLDFENITQMIYMRYIVELDVIKQCIIQNSPAWLMELERFLDHQKNRLNRLQVIKESLNAVVKLKEDDTFHEICFRHAGKQEVWTLIQNTQLNVQRLMLQNNMDFEALQSEHVKIVEGMLKGDVNLIESLLLQHVERPLNKHCS